MLFDGSSYPQAPGKNELEVSLFGAGFGEAVAIHVGDGVWTLIDSCVFSSTGMPASLKYLEDIGASTAQVPAIVASHWDDDHVKGFSQLLRSCGGAALVLSQAFGAKDFLIYADAFDMPLTVRARGGARELYATIKHCHEAGRALKYSAPSRRVYRDDRYSHGAAVELWTLSPSDAECQNFLKWVAAQLPQHPETRRLAVGRARNNLSTVVLVRVGSDAMLFGGDLEEEGRKETGWSAVLLDGGRPPLKAEIFKVSHHGSQNGDHPGIWEQLLCATPHIVLAPWTLGGGYLPGRPDVERLLGRTRFAYAASSTMSTKPRKRDRAVERTIREATRSFAAVRHRPGLVRLRKNVGQGGEWQCELFGAALHLSGYFRSGQK